ncbi:hypothetical protein POM88_002963 [Heracleum sosnowskyi]|uniref:Uncharacterized protein n=1 Tax=Heracleum sosnowskyi TaxID=360622 RepID=A0AAD8JGK7_9APIA|nr:hypothetical protein POM88_002963 [Heracleum sosnowskyi]
MGAQIVYPPAVVPIGAQEDYPLGKGEACSSIWSSENEAGMTITIVKNLRMCEDCLITLELYDNSDQRICAHKEDPAVENIQDLVTPDNVAVPANQDVTMLKRSTKKLMLDKM